MAANERPYFIPEDRVPLPPTNADVLSTCCEYCIAACGYKVYRWPADAPNGGPAAEQNALNRDFPLSTMEGNWLSPNQVTQGMHNGKLHNIAIVPDADADVVNPGGGHSIRGGCIAQRVYNPEKLTRDRLQHPMIRVNGVLTPVSWDLALDVAAAVSNYVIEKHGESAWALKYFSYQYFENTYALTKLAFKSINTPAVAHHDHPSIVNSVPGWVDIGYDIFSASYDDFAAADCLLIAGTDPFETKTIIWNQWILQGVRENGTSVIMINPRRTAGAAFIEENGGVHLDVNPGSDTVVHMALQRIILENGWQDQAFIDKWVNNFWETDSGFGQGTRNTPWQWRTTWGQFQVQGFDDWKDWLFAQEESKPKVAAEISGVAVEKLYRAAELMAKPRRPGEPVKTSVCIEKGSYWSNNYLNTVSIGTLGIILGCGGREGRVITRLGGHQQGGRNGGPYPTLKSPYKMPGRRRHRMDVDRWVTAGHIRFAYVVGTTWVQSATGSEALRATLNQNTRQSEHQITSLDKDDIIETLKRRVDAGGMVIANQDIYLTDPIGAEFADIVLPAASWGEEDFTRTNGERRIRLYSQFYDAPGEALPDWKIVAMLAQKMGFEGYDWDDSNDVFEESCRFSRGSRTDYNVIRTVARRQGMKAHDLLRSYGTTGLQCPLLLDGDTIIETRRLHDFDRDDLPATGPEGVSVMNKSLVAFKSHTGKLNILKSPWSIWSDFYDFIKPQGDELWVTNSRINELWESGFDDAQRRPYIIQRWPGNFLEINTIDAADRGIESGDIVRVTSERVPVQTDFNLGIKSDDMWFSGLMKRGHIEVTSGSFEAIAMVTDAIKQGVTNSNFLDKKQPSNAITPRVPDPLTMNYRFKVASGQIEKIGESPHKTNFAQMSFARRDIV